MVSLFRKEMDVNEAVGNLVGFAFDQNDIKLTLNEITFSINVDRNNIMFEMIFLRAFAVEFAIYFALDDRENEAYLISDKYRDYIIEVLIESSVNGGVDAIKIMEERLDYYVKIVGQSSDLKKPSTYIDTVASKIGESFAEICNCKKSIEVCNFGSTVFKNCIGGEIDFLRSIELRSDASSIEHEYIDYIEKGIAKAKFNATWKGVSQPTGGGVMRNII
jgi:hypothetical protein